MGVKYHNLEISVSGTTILCQSASISEQAGLTPIYALGYKGLSPTSPNQGIQNTFDLEYIVEPGNEVNFNLAQNIKNNDLAAFPVRIAVGGVTGAGYLNSFSLDILPNEIVKANVSYSVFTPLTGVLSNQNPNIVNSYNLLNGSGIASYWNVLAKKSNNSLTGSLISCNYNAKFNWQAIPKIGSAFPAQVKFTNGEENFSILSEYNQRIQTSGQTFEEIFTDIEILEISNLTNSNNIKLYPVSGRIVSNKINISEDNLILQETSVVKYY